ncbi:octopamine receptor beta-2R-like [Diadema antillarum]|uniref:octopamine receptor beta-2R-like n=1 Tax=Diadema antillarum TaxID=105358 RepID=UPI003A8952A0
METANWTTAATNPQHDVSSVFDDPIHINIISILYMIIAAVGMLGNILVAVAVSLSQKLHTVTNVFVVGLSMFDFFTCFALPFQAVAVRATEGWPLPMGICSMVAGMAVVTQSGSVLTLAMISINRYLLITKPKEIYQQIYTPVRTGIMVAFTFLFPLTMIVGPGINSLGYSTKYKVCLWDTNRRSAMVLQSIAAVAFFTSTLIIICCYTAIYRFIRRHLKDMHTRFQNGHPNANHHANHALQPPLPPTPFLFTGLNKRQLEITKNLGCVMLVFFACVLPYSCILLYPTNQVAGIYIAMLFLLPSTINPILYAAKHPHFRVVFRCMLHCQYSAIPKPSRCLKKLARQSSARSDIIT